VAHTFRSLECMRHLSDIAKVRAFQTLVGFGTASLRIKNKGNGFGLTTNRRCSPVLSSALLGDGILRLGSALAQGFGSICCSEACAIQETIRTEKWYASPGTVVL
jgi:hypothetical protein